MESFIQSVVAFLGGAGAIGAGAFILDIVMRRWPTAKPVTVFLVVASGLKQVIVLLEALSAFFDKIIPQNTQPPQA